MSVLSSVWSLTPVRWLVQVTSSPRSRRELARDQQLQPGSAGVPLPGYSCMVGTSIDLRAEQRDNTALLSLCLGFCRRRNLVVA